MEQNNPDATLVELYNGMSYIITALDKLETSIHSLENDLHSGGFHWMTIEQLAQYIPTHPTKPTIYQWVRYDRIPFHKIQGCLIFLKEEIDQWLLGNGNNHKLNVLDSAN